MKSDGSTEYVALSELDHAALKRVDARLNLLAVRGVSVPTLALPQTDARIPRTEIRDKSMARFVSATPTGPAPNVPLDRQSSDAY